MDPFPPLTHVALTVRDLSVSVPWYERLLEAEPVIDEDTDPDFHHTVYLLGNGTLIGLHQHKTSAPPEPFSEYRVGLDHLAFGCADRAELERCASLLDELGIAHGGIKDATYGSGVSFRDPDGIALGVLRASGLTARWPRPKDDNYGEVTDSFCHQVLSRAFVGDLEKADARPAIFVGRASTRHRCATSVWTN